MMLMKAATMVQLQTAHAASRDEHVGQIYHVNLLPTLRSIGENHQRTAPHAVQCSNMQPSCTCS